MTDWYGDIYKEFEEYTKWAKKNPAKYLEMKIMMEGIPFYQINERWEVWAYRGKFYLRDKNFSESLPFIAEWTPDIDFEKVFEPVISAVKDYKKVSEK